MQFTNFFLEHIKGWQTYDRFREGIPLNSILNGKQFRSQMQCRSQLLQKPIWIFTVCKGWVYLGSAGLGLICSTLFSQNISFFFLQKDTYEIFCSHLFVFSRFFFVFPQTHVLTLQLIFQLLPALILH